MADFIDLARPLQLTTPGTAPIAGLTVADTAALEAIESPWPGMFVYVLADGKTYRVTELKEVTVGVFTKKAVKTYEPVPDNAALAEAGARPATIALPVPRDADNENVTLVVDFSTGGGAAGDDRAAGSARCGQRKRDAGRRFLHDGRIHRGAG